MIETAVQEAAAGLSPPILLSANPKTKHDAKVNLHAFSKEGREQHSSTPNEDSEIIEISSMPRMKKCYGWLPFDGGILLGMPWELNPPQKFTVGKVKRHMSYEKEYIAIIYEYVEEAENSEAVVGEVSKFLWLAGFGHNGSPARKNWKSSVLVDLSDFVHARGYGWHPKCYKPLDGRSTLWV